MKLPSKNFKNHENLRFHNSVRPDPAHAGPKKLRTICPHTSVLPKPASLAFWGDILFLGGGVGWNSLLNPD